MNTNRREETGESSAEENTRMVLSAIEDVQQRLESTADKLAATEDSLSKSQLLPLAMPANTLTYRIVRGIVWCVGVVFTLIIGGCVIVGGIAAVVAL